MMSLYQKISHPVLPLFPLAAMVALLFIASSASADDATHGGAEERKNIQLALNAYHGVDAKTLNAAAKDPQVHLLALISSPDTKPLTKLQALAALAHFPNAATLRVYRSHLKGANLNGEGSRELHRAIQGMAFAFGEEATKVLEPLLAHSDLQVRLTVVDAMSRLGEASKSRLREHLKTERNPLVIESIVKKAASLR